MVHLTLAISDFMLLLLSAVLWSGAGLAGWALLAAGALGGAIGGAAWWLRRRRR